MAQFIVSYIGGDKPVTQEQGRAHFAKYQTWLTNLGENCISAMNPLKNTHIVSPDGNIAEGSLSHMSGYTVLEAESIAMALALVKDCPFLEINGSLEVSELVKMG